MYNLEYYNSYFFFQLSGSYIEDDDRASNKGKADEMDMLMANIDTVARTVDMQMHMKGLSTGYGGESALLVYLYY